MAMDLGLAGKTALVLGASKGLGRTIAAFRASPRAGFITGSAIKVDGGQTATL